ncbi:MAG: hypothetical protein OHK0046_19360 [Anaerolineae bacterium]
MTKQNPVIIYIGSQGEEFEALVQPWIVIQPQEMMEALAMVLFWYPDLVILEETAAFAHDIYMHLRSINMEDILILSDHPQDWEVPVGSAVQVLPLDTPLEALVPQTPELTY